jgi:phosphoglycerate dehydrogenase-like enzyme
MNSDTILVSTTTGFTHIAKEVISFLGSRFISLKLESDFLKSITSTAELALTFVLMGLTGVQTARADVLKGNWNRLGNVRAKQVSSATAGIIGYGRLGRILASYLRPIVSKVVIWDIDSRACSQAQFDGFEISTNLERLISVSDVVSLHASVIPEQDPIIHKRTLIEAKPGLVLVNTSRGSLVCEEDIVWGVNCGVLQSYWTDVLSCEESGENLTSSKLWQESLVDDRICITPHIGGASKDAIEKCEMQLALRLKNAI